MSSDSNLDALVSAATTRSATGSDSLVHVDGDKLVVVDGAALPNRCPICNRECAKSSGSRIGYGRMGFSLRMINPKRLILWLFLTGIGLVLDRICGYYNFVGSVEIRVHFCRKHKIRQYRWIIVFLILPFSCVVWSAILLNVFRNEGPIALIPLLIAPLCIIPLIYLPRRQFLLRPDHFDGKRLWLKGCCEEFLNYLSQSRWGQR